LHITRKHGYNPVMRPRYIVVRRVPANDHFNEEIFMGVIRIYDSEEELRSSVHFYADDEIWRVDLDNLSALPPGLQHQIREIVSRTETYIQREGNSETFEIVVPGTESQTRLNEGDKMIQIENPKNKIDD
jgi:hypothetical protein